MKRLRLVLPFLALLLTASGPLAAYDLLQYYSLKTSTVAGVAPGGRIIIKTIAGEKLRGTMVSRTEDGLIIQVRKGEDQAVSWNDVRWVRGRTKAVGVDQARGLLKGDNDDESDDDGPDDDD